MSKPRTRQKRSSSLIQHIKEETIEEKSDQQSLPNLNADWVNSRGAWLIHLVIIALLKVIYGLFPWVSSNMSWTLTNLTYVVGSYIMFHHVTGIPFDFNSGAYDNLNMWEQIDDGDQYTPTKKFLLGVPVGLFLISTHYTDYDLTQFVINCAICLFAVIPKLPSSDRVRFSINAPNDDDDDDQDDHSS
ncbi:hypothetical protein CANCADRAFT_141442 [Tortispora caseinolytica NRRL Y-17796]|uniref:Protein ORM1 n=1 Tax=Tortispora caseinolytica NRRL Y-17796 TaxID=767744 RepID=A0A1E4TD46_9ASCO|nr:hypothetical protein CANCADRAFT_141442 [Tortispora caseinolytica NRRL Y-17796]